MSLVLEMFLLYSLNSISQSPVTNLLFSTPSLDPFYFSPIANTQISFKNKNSFAWLVCPFLSFSSKIVLPLLLLPISFLIF